MRYNNTLRWSAFGFGIFFALVVALGYIPEFNQGMAHVSMQAPASRLAFTAFGWYCAVDASVFLISGFVRHKPYLAKVLLNIPQVVISAIMLGLTYRASYPPAGERAPC